MPRKSGGSMRDFALITRPRPEREREGSRLRTVRRAGCSSGFPFRSPPSLLSALCSPLAGGSAAASESVGRWSDRLCSLGANKMV